ncbi:hypothetical protein ILUMI_01710 [Ignelater luminosus]|uniref:Uncharacterized protein n=1 Tax=Ignelater luminosus TaxID=2038154 RepID=A0A8K0GH63_IGNLU|nr:hypothetical protein ILUMI_01710 [Ignelater luminosus]
MDLLDKEKTKNNLVITGLGFNMEDKAKMKEGVSNFIKEKVGIESTIKLVRKIVLKRGIIEMENFDKKMRITELKVEGKQVKTTYKKLIIDGIVWKWNKKEQTLEETKQQTYAPARNNDNGFGYEYGYEFLPKQMETR